MPIFRLYWAAPLGATLFSCLLGCSLLDLPEQPIGRLAALAVRFVGLIGRAAIQMARVSTGTGCGVRSGSAVGVLGLSVSTPQR